MDIRIKAPVETIEDKKRELKELERKTRRKRGNLDKSSRGGGFL